MDIINKPLMSFKTNHHNIKYPTMLILILTACFAFCLPGQAAFAATMIHFDSQGPPYLQDISTFTPGDIAIIRVENTPPVVDNTIDTITVTVNSTDLSTPKPVDSINLVLTETGPNTDVFTSKPLIFTTQRTSFPVNSVITITQDIDHQLGTSCPGGALTDLATIDTLCGTLRLTSGGTTNFNLTETAVDSNHFEGSLKLSPFQTILPNQLKVNNNDVLSMNFLGATTNALVAPNDPGTGEILIAPFDGITVPSNDITVTYGATSLSLTALGGGIDPTGQAGGGGTGGLLVPGAVLDFLYSLVGGSPFTVTPPSFGGGAFHYSDGLTIVKPTEKHIFDISKYNQDIGDQVLVSGQPVNMTFKMFDPYNINAIIHSGLYFIPSGSDMITPNSIASIVYDKGSKIEVNDPTKIFSDASVTLSSDGKFQYFSFYFVPTKSFEKMSFLDRAWNDHKYSTDVIFHDADISQPKSIVLPQGITKYDDFRGMTAIIENGGFKKPQIMAHIHNPTDVFPSNEGGNVYWLYDSINHTVTLVISDKDGNALFSSTQPLIKKEIQPKGDYGFMKFTLTQLNRWDIAEEQKMMEQEAINGIEKKLMIEGYHQENDGWVK